MHLSLPPTVSFAVVLSLLSSSYATLNQAGSVIYAVQPYTHAKRGATIKGLLLIARQTGNDGCNIGFHSCDAVSCCRNDQNCVPGGCCPVGSICSGQSDKCTDPSLVLCPDKSGCCAAKESCVKQNGATLCDGGVGGGSSGGGNSGGSSGGGNSGGGSSGGGNSGGGSTGGGNSGGGSSGGGNGGGGSSGGSGGGSSGGSSGGGSGGGLGVTTTPNQVTRGPTSTGFGNAFPTTTSSPLFGSPTLTGSSAQSTNSGGNTSILPGNNAAMASSVSSFYGLAVLILAGFVFAF